MYIINTKIVSISSYVPEFVLTNEILEKMVDTNDDWITRRTGIKERRISRGEKTWELGYKAAVLAIERSGIKKEEIDLIICATASPDNQTPSVACQIAAELDIGFIPAFDVAAACSGFVYALDVADSYIKSGKFKTILLVTSETLSRIVDYTDRSTCILFGDGASSAVLTATEDETGVIATHLAADAKNGHYLTGQALPDEDPLNRVGIQSTRFLQMNGTEVFKFATRTVPQAIDKVLEKSNLKAEDIDHYILHQANKRIIDGIISKYNLDEDKVYVNLHKYGNTSSSSIGICFDEVMREGKVKKGDKVLFLGFGGGLTYGSAIAVM